MPRTTIERLRAAFCYEAETGKLTRKEPVPKTKIKIGDEVGSVNFEGYLTVYVDQEKLHVHRIGWALYYGEWPTLPLDHINLDKSDNRISNLRMATARQNGGNTRPMGRLGLKGVTKTRHGNFQAQIKSAAGKQYLGVFDTPDEAAHAYNKAAIQAFGEFARLNPVGQPKETASAGNGATP